MSSNSVRRRSKRQRKQPPQPALKPQLKPIPRKEEEEEEDKEDTEIRSDYSSSSSSSASSSSVVSSPPRPRLVISQAAQNIANFVILSRLFKNLEAAKTTDEKNRIETRINEIASRTYE